MSIFVPPFPDPRLAPLLAEYPRELFSDRFHRSVELIDRYGLGLAIDLCHELEIIARLNTWRSVRELRENLGFTPRFHIALAWLLDRLAMDHLLEIATEADIRRYRSQGELPRSQVAELRQIGLSIDPANAPTLDMLDRVASAYSRIARGEISGEEALFGMDQIEGWLRYFSNDNPPYAINNWLGALAATRRLAEKPGLRILEIGAGSGSGTEILLEALAERGLHERIEQYRITEPNAFFRRRGERRLKANHSHLALKFQSLDINQRWEEQGMEPEGFDLVYGINVLHVARNLRFSLEQVYRTLAPGGWLVIGECLRPFPGQPVYAELIFQVLDSFLDVDIDPEIRPRPGFLTPEQWQRAFGRAGFEPVEITPDYRRIREIYPRFYTGAVCGRKGTIRQDY